jgi:hypothetical protein
MSLRSKTVLPFGSRVREALAVSGGVAVGVP